MTEFNLDMAALAALGETISATAVHEEGLVKAVCRPNGVIEELQLEPGLHDLGAATAATEILAVLRTAQAQADAEYQRQAQAHIAAAMPQFGGGQSGV